MPPLLMFLGLLALIAILSRKARAVARDAGMPMWLAGAGIGLAVR